MINIKVTLPGFKDNLSISQFTGNEDSVLRKIKHFLIKR